ncbi:MAG: hypothetical protein ACREOI_19915 [bacterium]
MKRNTRGATTRNIQLYVLGLLHFENDTQETVILSRKQLAAIGMMFVSVIFSHSKPEAGDDDTYFKFKLSNEENHLAFKNFIGNSLAGVVREIQCGYYHHRIIFRLTFHENTRLHVIRNARAEVYDLIREKCFNRFTDCYVLSGDDFSAATAFPLKIRYIYSYSLILIPNGKSVIRQEYRHIKNLDYDTIFTTRNTTFGLYLPERRSIFRQRKHHVRVSVPSTVIYLDGKSLHPDLFDNFVDAIYYGGLYQKVKADNRIPGQIFKPTDTWTMDLLLDVINIINDSVGTSELNDISVQINRVALIAAIAATVISVLISIILR